MARARIRAKTFPALLAESAEWRAVGRGTAHRAAPVDANSSRPPRKTPVETYGSAVGQGGWPVLMPTPREPGFSRMGRAERGGRVRSEWGSGGMRGRTEIDIATYEDS